MILSARRAVPGATVLVGLALLAACSGTSSAAVSTSTTAAVPPASTSAPATASSTSAAPTSSRPAATSAAPSSAGTKGGTKPPTATADVPVLILEPDGLGVLVGSAAIRHLRFGDTDAATLKTVLGRTLGGGLKRNSLPECGQGPRASLGREGFSVLLDGDTFVGWTDQGSQQRHLTTAAGVGVGSSLKKIKASLSGVDVSDGSLGPEFLASNGFGGILDSAGSSAKATLVYAGETCFFR